MCHQCSPYWPQDHMALCWYPQTLVSSTSVMPGHSGRQYMEWGIMGYSPSLSETSKKTLRGVEGSGGGTSRVCKLSSAIWRQQDFIQLKGLIPTNTISSLFILKSGLTIRIDTEIYSHLDVWVHKLKHRSTSSYWLVWWHTEIKTTYCCLETGTL